ncbi:MAG: DinB family protein [Flavobacteriales bacterium]|jgi:uncharacterized damage-inducible protein DinB
MNTELHHLLAHDHWASHRLLDALHSGSNSDAKVHRLMTHILAAHDHWLARVKGSEPAISVWDDALDPSSYEGYVDRFYEQWKQVLSNEDMDRVVTYANLRGTVFSNTIREIVLHVAMHGQYHRGQVVQHARNGWEIPPSTDLIVYFRERSAVL